MDEKNSRSVNCPRTKIVGFHISKSEQPEKKKTEIQQDYFYIDHITINYI